VASGTWHHSTLQGRDVYIVEDEALVAMLLDDLLQVFGCQVAEITFRVETALKSVAERIFAVAILSMNLKGETNYPVANVLELRRMPFLFATGYGIQVIPEKYRQRAVAQKPFRKQDLEKAIPRALK